LEPLTTVCVVTSLTTDILLHHCENLEPYIKHKLFVVLLGSQTYVGM